MPPTMTTEPPTLRINGNLNLIISCATLIWVVATSFYLGRKFECLDNHMRGDWNLAQMETWSWRTKTANPDWSPADVRTVAREVSP